MSAVAGRLDFALTPTGLKVYEYNADSASCLLQCGEIQDAYAEAAGITEGRAAGGDLFPRLVAAWRGRDIKHPVHFLCDDDAEEEYHSKYMMAAATAAGLECKLFKGRAALADWKLVAEGRIVDSDGVQVENVWKTWSWNTIIGSLSHDSQLDWYLSLIDWPPGAEDAATLPAPTGSVELHHIFLDKRVRIFEPLWTVLPSSKAILPLLWKLKPRHPYLLYTASELSPQLRSVGYASKPVKGRAGRSITLHGATGDLLGSSRREETPPGSVPTDAAGAPAPSTEGLSTISVPDASALEPVVFQELCVLPVYGTTHVQMNTFVVRGEYGGPVVRADADSAIIHYDSSIYALRVVPGGEGARAE